MKIGLYSLGTNLFRQTLIVLILPEVLLIQSGSLGKVKHWMMVHFPISQYMI